MKFKRLSDLSTDQAEIVAAIKNSKAGLIEVAEDSTKIRRDPAIPLPENTEESRKALEARTVYAKGFDKENTTLDELIDHFNETNPKVVSVQMRNWADKKGKEKVWHFKGSIFITFKSEEAATEFVETKNVKYKDSLLDIKFQKNYFEEKAKENEARKKGKEGDIAFVTYEKGEAEAKIRFKVENFAKPIAEKWGGMDKVEIKGTTAVGTLLEGEEEEKFLADSVPDLKNR